MKKVIRLTESDLVRIVKRVIRESEGDDSPKKRYESTLWKTYDFLPAPDKIPSDWRRDELPNKFLQQMTKKHREIFQLEHIIDEYDLNKIIKLLGGEDRVEQYLSLLKPLGITSLDKLIEYKGGYPEDEYPEDEY